MELLLRAVVLLLVASLAVWLWRATLRRAYIMPGEIGLLYGRRGFERELPPGAHRWFDPSGTRKVFRVSAVRHALHGQLIEVISKDQFAFRVTVTPVLTIADPRAFIENTRAPQNHPDPGFAALMGQADQRFDQLGPVISAALLEAVAARTLEDFLAQPQLALVEVKTGLADALPGARLDDLLLTAVNLPPEVRKMFTEVERARREGLAGLERARAEQAALRALANAARNLADNPALAQLRMLQTMENAKGAKTFVLGNPAEAIGVADRQP